MIQVSLFIAASACFMIELGIQNSRLEFFLFFITMAGRIIRGKRSDDVVLNHGTYKKTDSEESISLHRTKKTSPSTQVFSRKNPQQTIPHTQPYNPHKHRSSTLIPPGRRVFGPERSSSLKWDEWLEGGSIFGKSWGPPWLTPETKHAGGGQLKGIARAICYERHIKSGC